VPPDGACEDPGLDVAAEGDRLVGVARVVHADDVLLDARRSCRLIPYACSRAYAQGGVLVPGERRIGEFRTWLRNKLEVRSAH
jgi:hypothetical protein